MFLGKPNGFLRILLFCRTSTEISTVSLSNHAGGVDGSVHIFTVLVHVSKLSAWLGVRERAHLHRSRTCVQIVCVAGSVTGGNAKLGSVTGGNAKLGPFLMPRRFI